MAFMAGIIARGGELDSELRQRFRIALSEMENELPWRLSRKEAGTHIFAHGGFGDLWQGPAIASLPGCDAVGTGVQWRELPGGRTALEHLTRAFVGGRNDPGNYFDCFGFAAVDRESGRAVLATDPLGTELVFYSKVDGAVVFSSHQIFVRKLLGERTEIDWQGVFEFLLLGHNFGERTLFKKIKVLPQAGVMELRDGGSETTRYDHFDDTSSDEGMTTADAADMLLAHLDRKIEGYAGLARLPFAVLLSGGWDSRLIFSSLARRGKVAATYTTQQSSRFGDRIISEKKIAREISRVFGVKNSYTAPVTGINDRRARVMDYASWFNGWAFALADRLPFGKYILSDGHMGCIWNRGRTVTPEIERCLIRGDRDACIDALFSKYINGYNSFTPGLAQWKKLLDPSFLDGCAAQLKRDMAEQIHRIRSNDYFSSFIIANRSRRAATTLSRLIFGRKGISILPYGDIEYRRKVHSCPLKVRYDLSLGREMLKRGAPELTAIPTTSSTDPVMLAPYLVDSFPRETGRDAVGAFFRRLRLKTNGGAAEGGVVGVEGDLFDDPPTVFTDLLAPGLKRAIEEGDRGYDGSGGFRADAIFILDLFLRE